MLTIRLQRTGKRNQADFRIVLAEKESPVNKKIVEMLGTYNPRKKLFRIKSEERLKYWIAQHVALSPTVHNLFVTNKVLDAAKVQSFTIPKKKEEKAAEVKPAGEAKPAEPATEIKSEKSEKSEESDKTEKQPEQTQAENTEVKAEEKKE